MVVFFAWVIWFWLLITIFGDVFRRHDISGWKKTLWIIFVIALPFLGVFIYLITQQDGMHRRSVKQAETAQAPSDASIRSAGSTSGTADEIAKAKGLLDSGAITQPEFDAIKAKALV